MATAMGVELLTEEEYFELQKLGEFDTKRSSWIKTPAAIRKLGGALYCDRRYGRVFVGHNGADSYYSGRAFRGALTGLRIAAIRTLSEPAGAWRSSASYDLSRPAMKYECGSHLILFARSISSSYCSRSYPWRR